MFARFFVGAFEIGIRTKSLILFLFYCHTSLSQHMLDYFAQRPAGIVDPPAISVEPRVIAEVVEPASPRSL